MNSFLNLFSSYKQHINGSTFAVAVSGGADSMALCLMLKEWANEHSFNMIALTVDHQLREGSNNEAEQVHTWLKAKGIQHKALQWQHTGIATNLQEAARNARYELMTEYCKANNIQSLFVAHHALDQYETFFMRLSHASGLTGLTCMRPLTQHNGINIMRPLLNIDPTDLTTYLQQHNQAWIEDPSNQNTDFERVKWRNRLNDLCSMGLSPSNILKTQEKLYEANKALDWATHNWLQNNAHFYTPLRYATLSNKLAELPTDIIRRIMFNVTSFVRNKPFNAYHFRHNMQSALNNICTTPLKPFTLGGCYWFTHKQTIYVVREWSRCSVEVTQGTTHIYDNRFTLNHLKPNTQLYPVGRQNWLYLKQLLPKNELPHEVFLSLPCILDAPKTLVDMNLYKNLW